MKNFASTIGIFFILFFTLNLHAFHETKGDFFKVEIIQNNSLVKPVDGIIHLKKQPFKFRITFTKSDNVDVSASWGTYYFDYPEDQNIYTCDNDDLEGCRFVAIKTGIQDKFNTEKDLSVGDGDYQANWFYHKDTDWHRFDRGVIEKEGIIIAEMTVENIFDCDARDCHYNYKKGDPPCGLHQYKIEAIEKDIYMVFATSQYEMIMTEPHELQREKFILRFH